MGADFDGPAAVRLGRSGGSSSQGDARAVAKEWATMAMTQSAKLAHRWTGRIGTKPQLAEEVISGTEHLCTPADMMASSRHAWVKKWQKTRDSTQDTVMAVQEDRARAKGGSGPALN